LMGWETVTPRIGERLALLIRSIEEGVVEGAEMINVLGCSPLLSRRQFCRVEMTLANEMLGQTTLASTDRLRTAFFPRQDPPAAVCSPRFRTIPRKSRGPFFNDISFGKNFFSNTFAHGGNRETRIVKPISTIQLLSRTFYTHTS
jgi:hypothetical protein